MNGGTKLFQTEFVYAHDNLGSSDFPMTYTDSAGITLRIDNCGTYALYQYTPWVKSNVLFLQVMKMFWPGSSTNAIDWS